MSQRILIVDDDQDMCELIQADLQLRGLEAFWLTSPEEAFSKMKQKQFDVVLTDLNMKEIDGIELCHRIVSNWPDIPVIVITAFGSLETAVAAIRAGAYDFVSKPVEMDMLALTIERGLQHRALREEVKTLTQKVRQLQRFDQMLGESAIMQDLYYQLKRIAHADISVLISGETGTGKELVAKALHQQGPRKAGPFIAVNCAALPELLLESELFGHTRGAFTDAKTARKGLFLQAKGGTLFLDEIGDFPLPLQSKLLRALEERSIRQLGSDREIRIDVRIIAATNHDLETDVEEGRFREDLFFRINVVQIESPPLRLRGTDTLLLAQYFLEQAAEKAGKAVNGLSQAVAEKLLNYTWPGNVRELRNVIDRAVALTDYEQLVVEDLPEKIRAYQNTHILVESSDPETLPTLGEMERRYILHVLKTVGENRTLAARVLGFDRKTLYRKLQRYGLENEDKDC